MKNKPITRWTALVLAALLLLSGFIPGTSLSTKANPLPGETLTTVDGGSIPYAGRWIDNTTQTAFTFTGTQWWSDEWSWLYNNVSNATDAVTFHFTGDYIALNMTKHDHGGKVNVYVDGTLKSTIDTVNPTWVESEKVFEQTGLTNGAHTIKVEVAGKSVTTDAYVLVKSFVYGSPPAPNLDPPPAPAANHTLVNAAAVPNSGQWTGNTTQTAFTFTGTQWWSDSWSWMYNNVANANEAVQFAFTGNSIALYMTKHAQGGKVNVYVDGTLKSTVDTANAGWIESAKVFEQTGLTQGAHTIKVEVAGKSIAGDAYVLVKAFDYGTQPSANLDPPPAPATGHTLVDKNAVPNSGQWTANTSQSAFAFTGTGWWSDGWSWMYDNVANANEAVQFNFTGNSIKLYLTKHAQGGKANIYVDGTLKTTVDTANATWIESANAYELTGLTQGAHSIKVEVAGKSISGDAYVLIKAFDYGSEQSNPDPGTDPDKIVVNASSNPHSGAWTTNAAEPEFTFNGAGWWSDGWSWMYDNVDNADESVDFHFTGTTIALYMTKQSQGGIVKVYIDGLLESTVDTYNAAWVDSANVFEETGLPAGAHTLTVKVSGKSISGSAYALIKAFEYTPSQGGGTSPYKFKLINVTSPAYYSTVSSGTVGVTFYAPGFTKASAESLHAPDSAHTNPYGYMKPLTSADITLDQNDSGKGSFTFNASDFPKGPAAIHIRAWNANGESDDSYLQIVNNAGSTAWNGGPGNTRSTVPAAIAAHGLTMQQVFLDDFTTLPTISYTGTGDTKYAAAKPDPYGWPEYADAKFTPPNWTYGAAVNYSPFSIVNSDYMKIETKNWNAVIEPNWGQKFTTGFLASMGTDGSGFVTKPGAAQYFETRLFLPPNPGLWPAFWTLTPNDPNGRPGNDELDVLEAYMGGNPTTTTYNHHTWGDGYGGIHTGGTASTNNFGSGVNLSEGWHTYGMLITEDTTYYYFDDQYIPNSSHATLDRSWTVGNYFMINNAFRKSDADSYRGGFDRYGNTGEMYVDWVRVFQVQNTGFTPLFTETTATPGSTVSIDIQRGSDVQALSGTYNMTLPTGWSVASGGSFASGHAKDTIVLGVPASFQQFQGTIGITPVAGGTTYPTKNVGFTTKGLYNTEISPSLNASGGYNLNFKYSNHAAGAVSNIVINASGPNGWTQSKTISSVAANASGTAVFTIPTLDGYAPGSFTFHVSLNGYSFDVQRAISALAAKKTATPITIDGTIHAGEWTGATDVVLNQASQASGTWGGVNDQSATAKAKWDDDYLYLTVQVKDDVHSMTQANIVDAWAGDSLQVSFDPARAAGPVAGGPHLSFTSALNSSTGAYGIAVDRSDYAALGLSYGQLLTRSHSFVKRDEVAKTTTYTLAFDWDDIRPAAYAGSKDIGISFVINDSDGSGRKGWLSYMGGIANGKDPAQFGDLILAD
ncbi:sugar-binding protein [Paenibacillus sacheonensis]|uniref:GH16 domain-containing protein n=1 Tax=Paenibacillus sacheonensis TaxID=742054 RepID=A0A7X4YSC5_9BACL|nr:sugar-binding protein [Paenibacillus sacheonensis]MBM7566968.1 hypothetical protein [Paenibacillus sacheonensis]NBC71590.1 hypothetical protein [Paenibacillus sacheonensis]